MIWSQALAATVALLATPLQLIEGQSGAQTSQIVIAPVPFFDTYRSAASDSVVLFRPSGMTRLADGRVVVGDDPAPGVRVFAPDGRLLKTIGRRGAGPKEFQLARVIGTCGSDSILVHDGANSRYVFLSLDGEVAGERKLTGVPVTIACNRSRLVAESRATALRIPDAEIAHRGQESLSVRAFSDSIGGTIVTYAGWERQRFTFSDGPRPLGKRTGVAVASDRIYVGTADSATIRVFSFSGRELPPINLGFESQRISKASIALFINELIVANPRADPQRLRDAYQQLEYPQTFPAHGALLVAPDGRLWVERYRRPGETVTTWAIFGRDGSSQGELAMPEHFRLEEVGADYLLGSWRAEDDSPHVRAYRIQALKR